MGGTPKDLVAWPDYVKIQPLSGLGWSVLPCALGTIELFFFSPIGIKIRMNDGNDNDDCTGINKKLFYIITKGGGVGRALYELTGSLDFDPDPTSHWQPVSSSEKRWT